MIQKKTGDPRDLGAKEGRLEWPDVPLAIFAALCPLQSFVMSESMGRSDHNNFRLSSGSFILILGECAKQHCLVSVSSSKCLRRDGLSGPKEAGTDTV